MTDLTSHDDCPIVLVAPGTGGHVFPAVAVAQAAFKRHIPVILVTDDRGLTLAKPYTDLFYQTYIIPKVSFSGAIHTIRDMWSMIRGHKPRCMIGFGTKNSLIPMLTGWALHVPTAVHQSDTLLGRANKVLSFVVKKIFTGHPVSVYGESTTEKWHYVGTPVRAEFSPVSLASHHCADDDQTLNVLIVGGSQGAALWTSIVPNAIRLLSDQNQRRLSIVHQHRPEDASALERGYSGLKCAYQTVPFINDINAALNHADLVFSRAGGSTIAELLYLAKPSLLVPYAHSTNNHQKKNARFMHDHGLGFMQYEDGLKPAILASLLERCLRSPAFLKEMRHKLSRWPRPDSATLMLNIMVGEHA
jgi:UDP-N-acetylglucosamine--N-acetylmuramyl-(pentapeptide) pyrophosphoryl-undecaprenol N-acetylglucosamine transferase